MAKLESLTIRRFRNVEPMALRFHDRTNVLLGRNGSGKTTLLNLISMILRSDFGEVLNEEYDLSFRIALQGEAAVECDLRNLRTALPAEITQLAPDVSPTNEQRAVFRFFKSGQVVAIAERLGEKVSSNPTLSATLLPRYYVWPTLAGIVLTAHTSRTYSAARFDEGLDYYRQIFESATSRPVFRRQRNLANLSGIRDIPDDVSNAIFAADAGESLSFRDDRLLFLSRLNRIMGFVRGEYLLDVLNHQAAGDTSVETSTSFGNVRARFYWDDESFVSNGELSYGQKRLLALAHYIACNPDFVVADELVNGLHHEWIEFCLAECGDRQVFLTSQNPLLFDYLEFGSPEELQRQFVLCSLMSGGGRPRMKWTQMSDEKAADFHGATVRGIQYISEILQTEGLW